MKLQEYDFEKIRSIRKKCIDYDSRTSQVVCRLKNVYCMKQVTGLPEMEGFFASIKANDYGAEYSFWSECGENLVKLTITNEYDEMERVVNGLRTRIEYKGTEGYKNFISKIEQAGGYINLMMVEALLLAGEEEAAKHFAEYRYAYLARQEEENRIRREKEERERAEREREEKQKQDTKICEAERAIRNHEWINNDQCGDETVILRLFDKYNISLPGRTKGSMRKRLKGLLFSKEHTVSVRWEKTDPRMSCPDSVFNYLHVLCEKISA